MVDKLVAVAGKEYAELGLDWLGHYNDPMPNWKEITEKEFAQSHFGTYSPQFMGFKQIMLEKEMLAVHYFVYWDGTGVAILCDYWGVGYYSKPKPKEPLKHVRYFSFTKCEHDYEEKNVGKCLHKYTCKKCGFAHTVDSSD